MFIFVAEVILISLVTLLVTVALMMIGSLVMLFWRPPKDEATAVEVMFKGVDDEA